MVHTLLIRHVGETTPARFEVVRLRDAKSADASVVPAPAEFPIEGLPDGSFMPELQWYLEEFLDYPFPPETDRAERLLAALRAWGQAAFTALFGAGRGRDFFHEATRDGETFRLHVSSDDPRILGWPWEALRDPDADWVVLDSLVERKLTRLRDPMPLPPGLPKDRVNILLVTARPFERDVSYRSISRPLVELIETRGLPASVTILRPPTLSCLREHLRSRPGYYHILHFDGHGGYGIATPDAGAPSHVFEVGAQGRLIFEKDDGSADPVAADTLSALLREHRLPAVVLNACQSASIDERGADAFASVAASLVKAGVRSVVAMAYSLYVSGAQEFLPAFYQRLFEEGDLTEAARAGRQKMYERKGRICARGRYDLHDWLVPVTYQQESLDLSFVAEGGSTPNAAPHDPSAPHGFVGRDAAILALERAMRRPPAAILIHGLAGVGKTTLARGFLQWLQQTGGLENGSIWLTFNEIRSFEFVLNAIGGPLFGAQFLAASREEKLKAIVPALRENALVLVFDNFESTHGIAGTSVEPFLPPEDQQALHALITALRGGKTKVVVTSRSDETAWLGTEHCFPLRLGGLQGEERWEYCERVLRDLGIALNRNDAELERLLKDTGGHPLLLRVLLKRLGEGWSVNRITQVLRTNFSALSAITDDSERKLFAGLRFAEHGVPEALRPLLVPLSLHERFVDANLFKRMATEFGVERPEDAVDRLLAILASAGLVRDVGQSDFELHPAVTSFLRSCVLTQADAASRDSWVDIFVNTMAVIADQLAPRQVHEQRGWFHLHGENFRSALDLAEQRAMVPAFPMLLQSIGAFAQNTRDFDTAERLFARLARFHETQHHPDREAAAYHQLGMIAQERRDFDAAEQWYLKSLAFTEKHGNEHGAALTYHQLGMVAQERRDFDAAEQWYLKSLALDEKHHNEQGTAISYHQLGTVAQERQDFDAAERWYLKALTIKEKQGNERGAAVTYHQLGTVAQARRDFDAAERWYLKALAIKEKQGNEHGAAVTYHQLGLVAHERQDFDAAEWWYLKSLAIEEKQGNEHGAAVTYHQLGIVAQGRRDFDAAERWYLKSLAIKEKQGDAHGAARSYGQLGVLAGLRNKYEDACAWFIQSARADFATRDFAGLNRTAGNFFVLLSLSSDDEREALRNRWHDAGLPPLPDA